MAENSKAQANSVSFAPVIKGIKRALKHSDIMFAFAMIGILTVLLIPIPTSLLDLLLGISITLSIVILMTVLFADRSLEFNSFPTILLIAAIFRLSLNIASTRLILSDGHKGADAAGHVIEAFGGFVMAGSVIIGAIIFAILTIINFIVITKGSGRIAEVSARFSLDAMPGKQMAIDADLSAGLIDEEEAKKRRKALEDENTFFGAMDGASKFVRGDAIAGLLITVINFIAGILIGVVQRDMSFGSALETYTILTIGDGLVSQIPALIVSTSAGLLVTKSGIIGSTDKAVLGQLGSKPQALLISSTLLFIMALMPVLPTVPFLLLSVLTGTMAYAIWQKANPDKDLFKFIKARTGTTQTATTPQQQALKEAKTAEAQAKSDSEQKSDEEPVAQALHIDSLKLELGYGLLSLINYSKGHKITDQIRALRTQLAKDLGFIMPSVRIQDNMQLNNNTYIIRVKDIECGKGEVRPEMLLVMNPTGEPIDIPGEDTQEPAFGLPAKWISESFKEQAMFKNYTVVDPPTVITTHITEVIKENITDLLSYSETQKLLNDISEDHQKLVADMVPTKITLSTIQRILQNLLSEGVSIRDLPSILEAISEGVNATQNITLLTEHVRSRLARQISHSNTNDEGFIPILALSPAWEQAFNESLMGNGEEKQLSIAPTKLQEFISLIRKSYERLALKGESPVLLTSPAIRPYVRSVIERFRPSTIVMSQNEIHPRAKIKTLGQL